MSPLGFAFGMTFLWIMFNVSSAVVFGDVANTSALLWALTTLVGLGLYVRDEE